MKGQWPSQSQLRVWLENKWQVIDSYKSLRLVFPKLASTCDFLNLNEVTRELCGIDGIFYFDSDTPLQLQLHLGARFQVPLFTNDKVEFSINFKAEKAIYRWKFIRDSGCVEQKVGQGFESLQAIVDEMMNT